MAYLNIASAKNERNDEFYTQLEDIQLELKNYTDKFKGKVIFCNCDDPFESKFVKYFLMNFNRLEINELIATGYKTSSFGGLEFGSKNHPYVLRVKTTMKYLVGTQKDLDIAGCKYFLETEGANIMSPLIGNYALDEEGNKIQITEKETLIDQKTGKKKTQTIKQDLYYEAGDFRSEMSLKLLEESDIVVTNPPFSLFREFVGLLTKYNKQFLIIGNINCITYKEIFPLLKENKAWLGNGMGRKISGFIVPQYYELYGTEATLNKKEERIVATNNALWLTNIDHPKRHMMLPLDLGYTYKGHEEMYPKYDNYDAIEVSKTSEIPCDYKGVMGVPITFLDKYCPEQFEILGCTANPESNSVEKKERSDKALRLIKANRLKGAKCVGGNSNIYIDSEDYLHVIYHRILIRKK
jgi:hypothetical protein